LNDVGCRLYWPENYWYPKVDAVVRQVVSKGIVNIIAIQITFQEPQEHQQTLDFFRSTYRQNARLFTEPGENASYYLIWITPYRSMNISGTKRTIGTEPDIEFIEIFNTTVNDKYRIE
jgi:hypothetical protein